MLIRPNTAGPIAMPTIRKRAISGTLIFWATKPVTVPMARMRPPENKVCLAISMAADDSTTSPELGSGAAILIFQRQRARCCPTPYEMTRSCNLPGARTLNHAASRRIREAPAMTGACDGCPRREGVQESDIARVGRRIGHRRNDVCFAWPGRDARLVRAHFRRFAPRGRTPRRTTGQYPRLRRAVHRHEKRPVTAGRNQPGKRLLRAHQRRLLLPGAGACRRERG